LPAGFSAASFAAHADGRVRREALRLQFRLPTERDQALVAALSDDDPRALQFALHAARQGCPAAALPVVLARAQDKTLDPSCGRWRSACSVAPAPPGARAVARARRRRHDVLRAAQTAAKSPEMLAALGALAAGWPANERAGPVLAGAGRSDDPEIRATVGGAKPKR